MYYRFKLFKTVTLLPVNASMDVNSGKLHKGIRRQRLRTPIWQFLVVPFWQLLVVLLDCGIPVQTGVNLSMVGKWQGIGIGRYVELECFTNCKQFGSRMFSCSQDGQWLTSLECGIFQFYLNNFYTSLFHCQFQPLGQGLCCWTVNPRGSLLPCNNVLRCLIKNTMMNKTVKIKVNL
jgi:hypothetical protein